MKSKKYEAMINKFDETIEKLRIIVGEPFYYKDGFILYNSDCIDILKILENSSFKTDITVTSPPYNIGKPYETKMPIEKYVEWCKSWMGKIYSVTTDKGAFWLNLGYFAIEGKGLCIPISYLLWDKSLFYLLQEIVWKYEAGVTSKKKFCPRNEKWLFFIKDYSSYTFNLDDVRDVNVKYPNQKKNGKPRCNPLGKNPSDVWSIPKVTSGKNRSSRERTSHPAQFPLATIDRIVRVSSNIYDIVLDPFSGSGSTGIAATNNNRIFIGIEIRRDYCEMSIERFEKHIKNRDYF